MPGHVDIASGHGTDCTLGPTSLDRVLQIWVAHALPITVRAVVYASSLDAHGLSPLLQAQTLTPVLALPPRRGEFPTPTGTATPVNADGVPLCPAGLPLRRHSLGPGGRRIYDNWPVQRPTRRAGRTQWSASQEACPRQVRCQPPTQLGPVVSGRTVDDPRLSPPSPRDRATLKERRARRTGGERSNSSKQVPSRLGERPCRSAMQLLVRLGLVSLLEHACAWLAEDRTRADGKTALATQPQEAVA